MVIRLFTRLVKIGNVGTWLRLNTKKCFVKTHKKVKKKKKKKTHNHIKNNKLYIYLYIYIYIILYIIKVRLRHSDYAT